MLQDLRFAVRCLVKAPSFTIPALLTLALGIGSNTAVLSVVNAVVLRPLPGIGHPGRLAWIDAADTRSGHPVSLRREDLDAIEALGAFARLAASAPVDVNLTSRAGVERVPARLVNAGFFEALGVTPGRGRLFSQADAAADTQPLVVLSWDFWQRQFGGDAGVIGAPLRLNGRACTTVGIAPRGFIGVELADRPPALWVLAGAAEDTIDRDGVVGFSAIARLRDDIPREQATAALEVLAARQRLADEPARGDLAFRLVPMAGGVHPADRGDAVPVALVGLAVAAAVLLIACANVAGLLLARASRREREIGIRVALGATGTRLVRQLLTESLLLAVVAGAGAIPCAWWGTRVLTRVLAFPLPLDLQPDTTVLAGTLVVSLLAALAFGLAPALGVRRTDVNASLAGVTLAGPTRARARRQRRLVAGQVAVSIVLLAMAGVLLQHLRAAAGADVQAAAADRLLVASFDLAGQGYSTERQRAFGRDLLARLEQVPAVDSAGLAALVPAGGTRVSLRIEIEGRPVQTRARMPAASANWVSPGYFRTLGTPVVRGRNFTEAEASDDAAVAVVSETMARRFWPGEDAVGKRFRSGRRPEITIVGVVAETRYDTIGDSLAPSVFFPGVRQLSTQMPIEVLVRSRGDAADLLPIVRGIVAQMDSDLPLVDLRTMEALLAKRRAPERAASVVLFVFGALALVLTAIGVYGMMAYAVERRRREIGVRVALGAKRCDVVRLLARESASLAFVGVTVGVVLAIAATSALSSFAGIPPAGASLLAGVSAVIVICLLMACWIPVQRALRVDPTVTLRVD